MNVWVVYDITIPLDSSRECCSCITFAYAHMIWYHILAMIAVISYHYQKLDIIVFRGVKIGVPVEVKIQPQLYGLLHI